MAGELVRRAARIVAHYEDVRQVAPGERRLGVAFRRFLEALVPHMGLGGEGLWIRVPEKEGARRVLTVYATHRAKKVFSTFQYNDVDRDGVPWTDESLLAKARKGDRGAFDRIEDWGNPYLVGAVRSQIVWWGGDQLWGQCGRPNANAARLAWETLHGSVAWEAMHGNRADAGRRKDWVPLSEPRLALTRQVLEKAERVFPGIRTPPVEVPLSFMAKYPDASLTQCMAYHLIDDPAGPGLPKTVAADVTGRNEWRTLDSALRGFYQHYPDALRWPASKPTHAGKVRFSPADSTMAHH